MAAACPYYGHAAGTAGFPRMNRTSLGAESWPTREALALCCSRLRRTAAGCGGADPPPSPWILSDDFDRRKGAPRPCGMGLRPTLPPAGAVGEQRLWGRIGCGLGFGFRPSSAVTPDG